MWFGSFHLFGETHKARGGMAHHRQTSLPCAEMERLVPTIAITWKSHCLNQSFLMVCVCKWRSHVLSSDLKSELLKFSMRSGRNLFKYPECIKAGFAEQILINRMITQSETSGHSRLALPTTASKQRGRQTQFLRLRGAELTPHVTLSLHCGAPRGFTLKWHRILFSTGK